MRRSYSDRDGYGGGGEGYRGGGYGGGFEGRSRESDMDDPPNSRLFVIGGKTVLEQDFKEAFSQYGKVERLDIKKEKGISYVKFSKTSEAADALEALNGKTIGADPRPLKIVIASSRSQQQQGDRGDITALNLLRLYLIIPKTLTEAQLREQFEEFGPIEYVSIVKNKTTNTSRGFGYVKYFQFSHAARAFEGCDQSYRPKFADPRPSLDDRRGGFGGGPPPPPPPDHHRGERGFGGGGGGYHHQAGGNDFGGFDLRNRVGGGGREREPPMTFETSVNNPSGTCKLSIFVNPILTQEKLWKLFDIVPGLQHCEVYSQDSTGEGVYGSVVYNTPKAAAYAMEKLHGFDYPLGSSIMIKFDDGNYGVRGAALPADIKNLVNTIQHATQMLAASGYGGVMGTGM